MTTIKVSTDTRDRLRALGGSTYEATIVEAVGTRAVVLVEGISDQRALEALAVRRGRNLSAEGVSIVAMGGSKSFGNFLDRFGPHGLNLTVAGLCDAGEVGDFRSGLWRAGLGATLTVADMEALGFYICDADLEDELIRARGADAVEQLVEEQGELRPFRTLQKQPAQQGRTTEAQLRRFMGSRGGRKIQYAPMLVNAALVRRTPVPGADEPALVRLGDRGVVAGRHVTVPVLVLVLVRRGVGEIAVAHGDRVLGDEARRCAAVVTGEREAWR